MKVQHQDAYVLHTRPYRESSLLLELFTRDYGRVSLVAKGVRGRKKTPPRQFVLCLVSWVGRGPLFTLTDCELATTQPLQGDALACGFYINELLLRMTEPLDVHDNLFATYATTIASLAESGEEKEKAEFSLSAMMRKFEYALLQECGYAPDFTSCADTGEPINPDDHYELVPDKGFIVTQPSDSSTSGAELTQIFLGNFQTGAVRVAARRIFQLALRPHLGDRPLASRELLRPMGGNAS